MHVSDSARHFASYHETTMAMVNDIVLYDHIFGGHSTVATILILTRLKTDGIIAHIESIVVDQNVFTGFQVESVTVLRIPWISHRKIPDDDIFTH